MNPKMKTFQDDLSFSLKYYLDALGLRNEKELAEALVCKDTTAHKILLFQGGKTDIMSTSYAIQLIHRLEQEAVKKGIECILEAPGKWETKPEDLLDILSLCELNRMEALLDIFHLHRKICQKVLNGQSVTVLPNTIRKLCEATGSLPNELATKVI